MFPFTSLSTLFGHQKDFRSKADALGLQPGGTNINKGITKGNLKRSPLITRFFHYLRGNVCKRARGYNYSYMKQEDRRSEQFRSCFLEPTRAGQARCVNQDIHS